ncbi:GNAT family N-acetyltransferase [Streptomyces sp. NPDC102473]|uniref:GNAT family N-acetyltransferase n=1 Tax=Streptomyces sp. NPDC102473 TaxID=3366180 RepID=UPI0037F1DE9A
MEATSTASALTLRPWQDSDVPTIVSAHRDEAIRRWSTHPIDDEDEARAWLTDQRTGWADAGRLPDGRSPRGHPVMTHHNFRPVPASVSSAAVSSRGGRSALGTRVDRPAQHIEPQLARPAQD